VRFRQGVQAEVLLSLALIMFTATALLLVIFLETNHARIDALHPILARGFLVDSRTLPPEIRGIESGRWWHIDSTGDVSGLAGTDEPLDQGTRALGEQALSAGSAHVQSGAPWTPIRLATPDPSGDGVLVGRIAAPISGAALGSLIAVDILVFGLFGFTLLRRRVVGPLRRLAAAVRGIGEGDPPLSVPVEGAGEIAALGTAFNDMQAALAARTGSLEKAVEDLRDANIRLVSAREGLDRAERLAMVGSMAAGVAHEVGNPMGAMLAFLDVAGRDPGLGEESKRCLVRASEQGERVRIILRQLLDFSRPPQVQRVAISMLEVAHQVVELVSAQHEFSRIEFEVVSETGIGPATGDRSLASQILLNLVLNAAAALEGVNEPKIRLSVGAGASRGRSGDHGEEWTQRRRMDTIVCVVEDSGPGVTLEDADRIFDPFFTTKAPGKGTGLGLANALRLAEEMSGSVRLDAEPSQLGGARFVLALKATSSVDTDAAVEGEPDSVRSRGPVS
jgi:signal transduction histidine kinase